MFGPMRRAAPLLASLLWAAPLHAQQAGLRFGIVLTGDYPGDHPSNQEAAEGVAQRSPLKNIVGLASEFAPGDVDVVIKLTNHPSSFMGCGHSDIEAFSARSHQLLYTGKDTECNFKFTWENIGNQMSTAFAPGTAGYNAIQAEKAPPPPPKPARPAVLEREEVLPPSEKHQGILQAEKDGDAALAAGQRAQAFQSYTEALSGGLYDDAASRRVREKYMKLLAGYSKVPETPEEARRHMVRGKAVIKEAQGADDLARAYSEMVQAVAAAPWWVDAYYNLGLVEEKRGYVKDAIDNLKLYLLARPKSTDARTVQDKVYELEMRLEDKGR